MLGRKRNGENKQNLQIESMFVSILAKLPRALFFVSRPRANSLGCARQPDTITLLLVPPLLHLKPFCFVVFWVFAMMRWLETRRGRCSVRFGSLDSLVNFEPNHFHPRASLESKEKVSLRTRHRFGFAFTGLNLFAMMNTSTIHPSYSNGRKRILVPIHFNLAVIECDMVASECGKYNSSLSTRRTANCKLAPIKLLSSSSSSSSRYLRGHIDHEEQEHRQQQQQWTDDDVEQWMWVNGEMC